MNLNTSQIKVRALVLLAVAANLSVIAQTGAGVKPKEFEAFKIITDRNIFDPNRRPPRVNRETPPPTVDSFTLTGTMSYEKGFFAIFDGTSSDYHKVLEPGGKIAGHALGEITHDFVKLSLGTNEIELKVGMQMRRSQDGKWTPANQSDGGSVVSNSRRNGDRNERGGDRNDRRGRNNFRNNSPSSGGAMSSEATPTPPPEMANMDPNDPVARLMMRRLQETGGVPPNEAGGQNEFSNPVNVQGDGPNENVNQSGNTPENERTGVPANQPGNTNPTDNTPNR